MNNNNIKTIKTIKVSSEALSDIERLINNRKEDGLVGVTTEYNKDNDQFLVTLTYEIDGSMFDRFITINLQ